MSTQSIGTARRPQMLAAVIALALAVAILVIAAQASSLWSSGTTVAPAHPAPQFLPHMSDLIDWVPWSWSPDGQKLAGTGLRAGIRGGILVYNLNSQQYEKLIDFGVHPVWLSDSRRLLFEHQSKLYLIDSQSKKVRELLSVAPNEFGIGVTISRDERQLYFSLVTTEADIWLVNLE